MGCLACALGWPITIRFILAVQNDVGIIQWLELTDRHTTFLDSLREGPNGQIGARIRVSKAWKATNAPIVLELLGWTECSPIEMSRFVAALGLPAQRSTREA